MSKCGILDRSTTTGLPEISLPNPIGNSKGLSKKFFELSISESLTVSLLTFGNSKPIKFFPGIVSTTLIENSDKERAKSFASATICAPLTPTAGSIS